MSADDDVAAQQEEVDLFDIALRKLLYGLAGYDENPEVADDVTDVQVAREAIDRVASLEAENNELRNELAALRAQLESERGNVSGTKVGTAKRLARNECLRRVNGKTERDSKTGEKDVVYTASVEVGPIVEQAKGQNVDLAYTTVRDAFVDLEREWECFTHHDGSSSKTGTNRRLEVDARRLQPTLVESFRDDTGTTLLSPLTEVLSNNLGGDRR